MRVGYLMPDAHIKSMALGDLNYEQGQIVGARIDDSGQVELRGARTATRVGLGEHNGSGTEGDRGQRGQLSDGTPAGNQHRVTGS
jgi:hypothetical protein